MKDTLQAVYLKIDTTSKSLAQTALAQLILKIIHFYENQIKLDDIKKNINSILSSNVNKKRIEDALNLLINEKKINLVNDKYVLNNSTQKTIDNAVEEYNTIVNRILERHFQKVSSEFDALKNWFETVTINFFTEYKSEWIAEKTYKAKKSKSYEGLSDVVIKITKKDNNIVNDDKKWLINQYLTFFQSEDTDVESIFWYYGTSVFSSSLIIANTAADNLAIDEFRNSTFILDTNILMYLQLEEGKHFEAYKTLENIFQQLNITPSYFFITKEEYKISTLNKKDDVIRIIDNYEPDVVDELEDEFIKTAKSRKCKTTEDYEVFFDELLDIPEYFIESLQLNLLDKDKVLINKIEEGQNDETLLNEINEIYKNRHSYFQNGNAQTSKTNKQKDKRKRPLLHDAGLIAGAKYLRTQGKTFIISRDITVKQYGVENIERDDAPISFGLDTLISMLAINNGGIDISPTEFKPLFANIIKLGLFPQKQAFKIEDLTRMLDIEENISKLPSKSVKKIATEFNCNRFKGETDEKIQLQLVRSFQKEKLTLSDDLNKSKAELLLEKQEKEKSQKKASKTIDLLKKEKYNKYRDKYEKELRKNRAMWFIVLPLATLIFTLIAIILYNNSNEITSFFNYLLGIGINIFAWLITTFLFSKPKINRTYRDSIQKINDRVDKEINELIEE